MDVDAVQQRAGDALLVAGDDLVGAGARLDRVAVIAARAGVHRRDQLEVGGKSQRALGAADGDHLVFHRLAQHLQDAHAELGQLVQEEHAAVRQGDLAGVRLVAAAHQPGVRDGVVRGAEGPAADQRHVRRELVGDGIDAGHIQRLVDGHARQDARHGARQQGLAGAWRPNHQDIMPAGRGHLQGALDVLLAFDLGKVGLHLDRADPRV